MSKASGLMAVLCLTACASHPKHTTAWSSSMGAVFSNQSVKPAEPPRGYWTRQDEEMLLRRMGFADIVAVGTLRVVSQCNRSGVPFQLTLAFRPEEQLFGELEDEEVMLRLDASSDDFQRALAVQKDLVGTRYLMFFKRKGSNELRWAFYRPTRSLLNEIRARYASLARPR
jgi:hypothetical protein